MIKRKIIKLFSVLLESIFYESHFTRCDENPVESVLKIFHFNIIIIITIFGLKWNKTQWKSEKNT